MKSWQDIGFEIEITADGSPSLRLLNSVDPSKFRGESMHHSGGACSETNLIYGQPIKQVLQKTKPAHFLVVGLGLGYIEMVIAREALLAGRAEASLKGQAEASLTGPAGESLTAQADSLVGAITSFESVPELRDFFISWLHNSGELHPEVQNVYDQVLHSVLQMSDLTPDQIRAFLQQYFKTASDIQSALTAEVVFPHKYHCILYDAFSSKTSPLLWEEDFLNYFLIQGAAPECVLSTYACKGSLKRALKTQGFEVLVREGFQGKRNSTLGQR